MQAISVFRLTGLIIFLICASFPATTRAAKPKVLVVMSYEQRNPWCIEIKSGIDSSLADNCEITYFYMDTKINLGGGKQKAKEAYSLFKKLQPDGVITADDIAQSIFVVPYLRDKIKTPVMFCGVNAEPEKYGYPASNVSGILERGHIMESVAFLKQLCPLIKTIAFISKSSPSGEALLRQIEEESDTYLLNVTALKLVKTVKELVAVSEELNKKCDVIYMDSTAGIVDEKGNPLDTKAIIRILEKTFSKPIIAGNEYHVEQGALCAVVKTGEEQGRTAAEMLLKAMQGTPVSEIPITKNYRGKRVINVTVMERFGIKPKPIVLLGAKLVRTEE
jgi:ABC-type uncharacterized transport system substrate-binding protein